MSSARRSSLLDLPGGLGVPAAAIVVLTLIAPAAVLAVYAFLTGAALSFSASGPLTFGNVRHVLSDPLTRHVVTNTVVQGGVTTLLVILIALPVAYWLRYYAGAKAQTILIVLLFAQVASFLVKVYAWRTILGDDGLVNSVLTQLGAVHHPVRLLFTRFAVVIALVHTILPIVVLMLYAGLQPIEPRHIELVADIGAGRFARWRHAVAPLMASTVVNAGLLAFLVTSMDYVTPSLLGGPGISTLAVLSQSQFQGLGNYPAGAAAALVLLVGYVIVALLLRVWLRIGRLDRLEWTT